jgi:hypothetical protein
MVIEAEDAAGIEPDSLEDAVTIEEAVVEDRDGGLFFGDEFAVEVDFHEKRERGGYVSGQSFRLNGGRGEDKKVRKPGCGGGLEPYSGRCLSPRHGEHGELLSGAFGRSKRRALEPSPSEIAVAKWPIGKGPALP